jgi:hypothetical protein
MKENRRTTVLHEGEFYTVAGEWDRGATSMSRDCPSEPAGFVSPDILDIHGREVSGELSPRQCQEIVDKAEEEEAVSWTKSFSLSRKLART